MGNRNKKTKKRKNTYKNNQRQKQNSGSEKQLNSSEIVEGKESEIEEKNENTLIDAPEEKAEQSIEAQTEQLTEIQKAQEEEKQEENLPEAEKQKQEDKAKNTLSDVSEKKAEQQIEQLAKGQSEQLTEEQSVQLTEKQKAQEEETQEENLPEAKEKQSLNAQAFEKQPIQELQQVSGVQKADSSQYQNPQIQSQQSVQPQSQSQYAQPMESQQPVQSQSQLQYTQPMESQQPVQSQSQLQYTQPMESQQLVQSQPQSQYTQPTESQQSVQSQPQSQYTQPMESQQPMQSQPQSQYTQPMQQQQPAQQQSQFAKSVQPQQPVQQQPQLPPDVIEFFNGGIDELNKMLENVTKRDTLMSEIKKLAGEGKNLEKQLADEKKSLQTDLNKTIESEREKYISEETKIINDGNSQLKKVKNERNKAKERGIRDRIDNETSQLVSENKSARRYIRKSLKENGLPAYCDTKWFYALYCTQSFLEWLIKILVFLLGLVAIPWVVVEIVNPWWFLKIILWVVVVVIFIAIYMTIFLLTKDRDNGTLEDMREYRDKIDDNNKAIKKIKKNIKTDTDESHYNLEKYDTKIEELQTSVEKATASREEKLKTFEGQKKQQIIASVNAKHVPIIESRQNEINEKETLYKAKNEEYAKINAFIEQKYEKYLTKPYTNAGCINNMIQSINNNGAANIGQAYSMLKNRR